MENNGKWQWHSLSLLLPKRILFQHTRHQAKWRSKRAGAQPPEHLLQVNPTTGCCTIKHCERADHFQPSLPGFESSVPIVHQEERSGLFQGERDCFRLADVQIGERWRQRCLKIHHFQPSGWTGNPGTHCDRCMSVLEFFLDG